MMPSPLFHMRKVVPSSAIWRLLLVVKVNILKKCLCGFNLFFVELFRNEGFSKGLY